MLGVLWPFKILLPCIGRVGFRRWSLPWVWDFFSPTDQQGKEQPWRFWVMLFEWPTSNEFKVPSNKQSLKQGWLNYPFGEIQTMQTCGDFWGISRIPLHTALFGLIFSGAVGMVESSDFLIAASYGYIILWCSTIYAPGISRVFGDRKKLHSQLALRQSRP